MDLKKLENFLAVVREGSITGAASLLHMSQSALSRQMLALEEELGAKLFIRGRRTVTLTGEGEILRRRSGEILELIGKTEQEVANSAEELTGTIYIGSCDSRGKRILVKAMACFRKKYPRVAFQVFSMATDSIREGIEQGRLDVGLMVEPVNTERLSYVRLEDIDTWGVLMPKSWDLAGKESIKAEDLLGVPIMMPRRSILKNELTNWFGELYGKMDVVLDYNIGFNTAELVRGGLGGAMCFMRELEQHAGLCRRPLEPPLYSRSIIGWKKGRNMSLLTEKFVEEIKACS